MVARKVADQVVAELTDEVRILKDKLVTLFVDAWIGEFREEMDRTPVHFLPHFEYLWVAANHRSGNGVRIVLDRRLPVSPAWDTQRDHNRHGTWVTVHSPEMSLLIEEIYDKERIIEQRKTVVDRDIRNALTPYIFVRDARRDLPELDAFLPPDRTVNENARTPASMALALPLEPIREMLRSYGLMAPVEGTPDPVA